MNNERDLLTGLPNRGCGLSQLENAVAEAKQQSNTTAVILTDIDHFSDLNCSLGHQAGDNVLRQSAAVIQRIIAGKGIACRFGGDEFFVVLPSASVAQAKDIAEEIREQVAKQTVDVFGQDYTVTINMTIGIASYPANGQDAESLLRAADEAMWQSKKSGRRGTIRGTISTA